uniref:CCHC-type domain-containing protein n=1 Tax=Tanacetum cinerariifolium TaxID=118510 RepID=A0A699H559_TANCI|nr:hypothetical protein [Tanacetum cinerariifolium]
MAGEDTSQPPIASPEVPQMVSFVKLPILKKGEYIIWTIKIEHIWLTPIMLYENKYWLEQEKEMLRALCLWPFQMSILLDSMESKMLRPYGLLLKLDLVSNISLIMRNKPGIDNLDIDDLYNNLKVYKADIKGSSGSSLNSQNVAFVFAESTSSTNELNAAYSVFTATGHSSQVQSSSSYADELMFLFFATQSNTPQLDNKELEQIDQDDLEEIDLKWQVAMLSMRVKRFYKKTKRKLEFNGKEPIGFDKTKVECYNCHRRGHFARDCRSARNSGNRSRDARNARYRGRDNGKRLAKEEDENALLDEALREKEDLKSKLENFETSLKNLTKLLDSQISAKVKTGLGYDSQFHEKEVLDIREEEVTETVFDNRSSDEENSLANDRFKKGEGYHAVPPPLTGNYMPPKPDLSFTGLDDSIYKFKISETVTSLAKNDKDTPKTSTASVEKPKEDRMAKKSTLPTNVGKGIGHKESRPVWNNVQRINHQKNFASTAVFTRSGGIPVSAATPKVAASTSDAKPVNTDGPKQSVNFSKSRSTFHKSHSPIRRSFYKATTHSRRNSTERINTAGSEAVSAVKGNEGHPRQALKNKGIVDSGCSRHMTGNKAYLTDYQEINDGGFVAFGSSRASIDGSNLWHRRLGHVNFKTMNKLVKGNLLRGLPSKIFENVHTCVACQKVTDDFSRFSWVFFLASKDETSKVFKPFITAIENQINKKVKVIRCDNRTEFKNRDLDYFCGMKGIKREYSNARTPQQNGAEVVNTACYVLNRDLVIKTHNKTLYELLNGRTPRLDFMRPFGRPVTILNTLDPLGKFKGNQTEKNAGPQATNGNAGTQDNVDAGKEVSDQHYIVLPLWSSISSTFKSSDDKATYDKPTNDTEMEASDVADAFRQEFEQGCIDQRGVTNSSSTNSFNTVSHPVNVASTSGTFSAAGPSSPHPDAFIPANTLLHVD